MSNHRHIKTQIERDWSRITKAAARHYRDVYSILTRSFDSFAIAVGDFTPRIQQSSIQIQS
jgi:hypothetical protein